MSTTSAAVPVARRTPGTALRRRAGLVAAAVVASLLVVGPARPAFAQNLPLLAYVANSGADTVSVIDIATNTVVQTIPVGDAPTGVAVTPDGAYAYVTNNGDDTVSVIDTATNAVIATVPVGSGPFYLAISPDGSQVYVPDNQTAPGTVTVINTATNTVSNTITVGGDSPAKVVFTPDGSRAYVTDFNTGAVSVIDTATGTPVLPDIAVGGEPARMAITPDGSRLYVSNNNGTVSVVDTADNSIVATVPVGGGPRGVAINPDGTLAYVANPGNNTVSVISTATNAVVATIPVPGGPTKIAISPAGGTAYVTLNGAAGVAVVDTATNLVTSTIPVGAGPLGIAIIPDQAPVVSLLVNPQPAGQPTAFDASGTVAPYGNIATYTWDFGDGTPPVTTTEPVTDHVYADPGSYPVTVTATTENGTSTTSVYTGQTFSRHGGPSAGGSQLVDIPPSQPELTIAKSAFPGTISFEGQTISYEIIVTNTGNVPMTNVVVQESISGAGPFTGAMCPTDVLAPGEQMICLAAYTVTQADIDAGVVTNSASATGQLPARAVTSDTVTLDVPAEQHGFLSIDKTATPDTVTAAGQTVSYAVKVHNSGNTTIYNIFVADPVFSGTGAPPAFACPFLPFGLPPFGTEECTATYQVTQADIDAGTDITNTAVGEGNLGSPFGPPVFSNPSEAVVRVEAGPGAMLQLTKVPDPQTVTAAGQSVTYTFDVHNPGTQTVTGVTVVEQSFTGTGPAPTITCTPPQPFTLAPGATVPCTATYTVTQADIDSGNDLLDTGRAQGTGPNGPVQDTADATVIVTPNLSLTMTKSVDPSVVTAAGATVTYTYDITNNGTATVEGLAILEQLFTGTGTPPVAVCTPTTLAPQAGATCTATYTATQTDIDNGGFMNIAVAQGTDSSGLDPVQSPGDQAIVTVEATPGLSLVKSASPTEVSAAGQVVTYTFTAQNTGSVSLTGVTVSETDFTGSGTPPTLTCGPADLAPNEELTCTATYTVTQADLDAGDPIVNTATASGTSPTGPITAGPATAQVTPTVAPALAIVKTVDPTSVAAAGDTVTYTFQVANTGNQTIDNLVVDEVTFTGTGTPPVVTCDATSLAPSGTTTCTGTYAVTQDDIDAGSIQNVATATGTAPDDSSVTSEPSGATVLVGISPALSLAKSAAPANVTAAGQVVTYTYVVTNTGNVSIPDVTVAETAFSGTGTAPAPTCPAGPVPPGGQVTCTATYTVTQADIDAGNAITNTAVASSAQFAVSSNEAGARVTITPGLPVTGPATSLALVMGLLLAAGGVLVLFGLWIYRSRTLGLD